MGFRKSENLAGLLAGSTVFFLKSRRVASVSVGPVTSCDLDSPARTLLHYLQTGSTGLCKNTTEPVGSVHRRGGGGGGEGAYGRHKERRASREGKEDGTEEAH